MGRRRIEIRRIESEEARLVCFSNRRAGLFKKASELSILCGAHVAAVAFSPSGKDFSFGHTSVEGVLDRFLLRWRRRELGAAPSRGWPAAKNRPLVGADKEAPREHVQKARREHVEQRMAAAQAENGRMSTWVDADVHQTMEDDLMGIYEATKARADQVLPPRLPPNRRWRSAWFLRAAPILMDPADGWIEESDRKL